MRWPRSMDVCRVSLKNLCAAWGHLGRVARFVSLNYPPPPPPRLPATAAPTTHLSRSELLPATICMREGSRGCESVACLWLAVAGRRGGPRARRKRCPDCVRLCAIACTSSAGFCVSVCAQWLLLCAMPRHWPHRFLQRPSPRQAQPHAPNPPQFEQYSIVMRGPPICGAGAAANRRTAVLAGPGLKLEARREAPAARRIPWLGMSSGSGEPGCVGNFFRQLFSGSSLG
jgi:hypothetical protein